MWFCLDRDSGDLLPWYGRFSLSMEPMMVHGEMGWKGFMADQVRDETVVLSSVARVVIQSQEDGE